MISHLKSIISNKGKTNRVWLNIICLFKYLSHSSSMIKDKVGQYALLLKRIVSINKIIGACKTHLRAIAKHPASIALKYSITYTLSSQVFYKLNKKKASKFISRFFKDIHLVIELNRNASIWIIHRIYIM